MTDDFQLREDSAVAWLAFKAELGVLLTSDNEKLLNLVFLKGFSEGWGKGTKQGLDCAGKSLDKILGKGGAA